MKSFLDREGKTNRLNLIMKSLLICLSFFKSEWKLRVLWQK